MAGEDGAFSTKPMGFDKNEVNRYITNLRVKIDQLEAEKKVNDDKTKAAVKIAEDAEEKIRAAEQAGVRKIEELELQIKNERRNAEQMQDQIDDLKRKLRQAGGGGGADKQAAEIIENANATAHEIVEKAKRTAQEIVSGANSAASGGAVPEEFMAVLRNFMETVNSGFKTVNDKAAELLGSSAEVSMPDFSAYTAPKAEVPKAKPAAPKPEAPRPAAPKPTESVQMDSAFPFEDMGDDDMDMDGFGGDIQPLDPTVPKHEVVDGFDLSGINNIAGEGDVSSIEPYDEDGTNAEMDSDFAMDLLTQSAPGGSLDGFDDDLLSEVEKKNAANAVQPTDGMGDFDLDMDMGGGSSKPAAADNPWADLQAEFNSLDSMDGGSGSSMDDSSGFDEPEPSDNANQWAELQATLNQMEQSGNFGSNDDDSSSAPPPAEDRKVPDADDNDFWSSGDSSDDDDMSSDFGSMF